MISATVSSRELSSVVRTYGDVCNCGLRGVVSSRELSSVVRAYGDVGDGDLFPVTWSGGVFPVSCSQESQNMETSSNFDLWIEKLSVLF